MTTYGRTLRRRREEAGLTVEDLAYLSKVSAQQIRNIEDGTTLEPRRTTRICIDRALEEARSCKT